MNTRNTALTLATLGFSAALTPNVDPNRRTRARRHKAARRHRSARLVGGIWLFTLALFLLQLILPADAGRAPVQNIFFLVLILLALPSTLLLLADELRGRLRGRAGILAAYLFFVAAVAGIGALIGSLLLQPVPLLPLKLVIFVHLLLILGLLASTLLVGLTALLGWLCLKVCGRTPGPLLGLLLNLLSLAGIYTLAQLLSHWLPLDSWLNFLWLFRL